MDEICRALSSAICEAGLGGYRIFYEDELICSLPDCDESTLRAALERLEKGGYIDIKYARGDVFCIEARRAFDEKEKDLPAENIAEPKRTAGDKPNFKTYALLIIAAFLGGATGAFSAVAICSVF